MLIPIRQENSVIRRIPWVSIVIVVLNVVAFLGLASSSEDDAWERELMSRAKEAANWLGAHPYLEARPDFLELLEPRFRGQLRDAKEKMARQGAFIQPSTIAREQAELDRLVDRFYAWRDNPPGSRLGLVPRSPRFHTFLTSMFMHAGWLHLIGNMLFFYLTGPFVEDVFGRPLFAGFYLMAGIVAGGAHVVAFPDSPVPLVGASGAIAGVMGAFLVRLGKNRIQFLFLPIPIFWKLRFTFALPAFVVLPVWFAEQLMYARQAAESGGSGVAWWAHIGGFAFGAFFTAVFRVAKIEERFIHPAIEKEISLVKHPSLEKAMEARERGKLDDAKREIRRVNVQAPDDRDGWEVAFDLFLETGDRGDAARAATKLVEIGTKENDSEMVDRVVREAIDRIPESLASRFWFSAARWRMKLGDEEGADWFLERMTSARPNDPDSAVALLRRSALAAKRGDRPLAFRLIDQAAAHAAATDEVRRQAAQNRAALEAIPG